MPRSALPVVAALIAIAAGCGGSGSKSSLPATTAAPPATPAPTSTAAAPAPSGPAALQGEAASAATGDIPDNQVFLTFHNTGTGYSIRYPEGWAQKGSGRTVTFRDKNNIVRIVVAAGTEPTVASARRDLAGRPGVKITSPPQATKIGGAHAIKLVYTAQSPPNPVTGKRVVLMVDRYYLARGGRVAVVDLGTPAGVDNVDAYRLMIQSFRWR